MIKYTKIVILFFVFSLAGIFCATAQTIDVNGFEKGLSTDVQLLDVRTMEEFKEGHLKGAMLADWKEKEEFARRVASLDKKKPVFVYCLSGGRSAAALAYLEENGFTVTELEGGINAWKQADKAVEGEKSTTKVSEKEYQEMIQSAEMVLMNFGASWCPPCRKMEPVLAELKTENPNVGILNIDAGKEQELMKAYSVKQIPTYILYKNGEEVWRTSGETKKSVISSKLNTHQ